MVFMMKILKYGIIFLFTMPFHVHSQNIANDFLESTCPKNSDYIEPQVKIELERLEYFNPAIKIPTPKSELPCTHCSANNQNNSDYDVIQGLSKTFTNERTQKMSEIPVNQDMKCIATAMREVPRMKYYYCKNVDISTPVTKYTRPCISENYIKLMYKTFEHSTRCVGVDQAEVFPYLARESGFISNVRSSTGVLGVGQVSEGTLDTLSVLDRQVVKVYDTEKKKYISTNEPKWTYSYLNLKEKKECAPFSEFLAKPMEENHTRCDRVAMPPNPAMNLLNGLRNYLDNKDRVTLIVDDWIQKSKQKISEDDQNMMEIYLARWMYNGGAGVKNYFKIFTKLKYKDKSGKLVPYRFTTLKDFKDKFENYLLKYYESNSAERRGEVAHYVDLIDSRVAAVKKKSGGSCYGL